MTEQWYRVDHTPLVESAVRGDLQSGWALQELKRLRCRVCLLECVVLVLLCVVVLRLLL